MLLSIEYSEYLINNFFRITKDIFQLHKRMRFTNFFGEIPAL